MARVAICSLIVLLAALLLDMCSCFDISFGVLKDKRVLVAGGSGRVGGSVVTALIRHGSRVVVGGTNPDHFQSSRQRWLELFPEYQRALSEVTFVGLDRERADTVSAVLSSDQQQPFDLVVHTAGPFQGKIGTPNGILEACVENSVNYIDVCDDYCTAMAAKANFSGTAKVPCILSTGCWPGVSSLMAKQLVRKVCEQASVKPEDLSVDFSFFTAGSGGAGVTLLVATFLILAEKALTIENGRRRPVDAMRDYARVNFGDIVGDKAVAPLNLLETASVHDTLGVGSVSSRFGTAPDFWNALLGLMARLPPSLLANEDLMRKLSVFSMPIVRLVDSFAGATNSMRCDVTCSKVPGLRATAIYAHDNLEPCVGECVAAFACASLAGAVPAGVWFPEEAIEGGADAAAVLGLASVGAHTVEAEGLELMDKEIWGSSKLETTTR